MRRYIRQHVRACFQCIATKSTPGRQPGELHPIPPGKRPFHTVHIDHVGPFTRSAKGNKFVLVAVDNLTKFVVLKAVRDTKASNVVKCMDELVCDFGAPVRIVSDRATCFVSEKFGDFRNQHGIQHVLTSPRHAQANGQVECVNAVLVPMLQASIDRVDCKDWDVRLRYAQRDLNDLKNAVTGKCPFEALYGSIASHDEGWLRLLTDDSEKYSNDHAARHNEIAEAIVAEQQRVKARYDQNRATSVKFSVGDFVFFDVNPISTGDSTRFQLKKRGPLWVTEVLGSDTYRIAYLITDKKDQRYTTTAHVTQLKLWVPPRGENECENDEEADT